MKNISKLILSSILVLTSISLSSCSWLGLSSNDGDDKKVQEDLANKKPADEMYLEAKDLMNQGYLEKAIKQYQEIERLYPFSPYAIKSKVMEAYSQYKSTEYDKATDVIDEFVNLNPGNEEIEFMYYLKAMCYYDRIQDVKRDQDITIKAKDALNEVINRFPKSNYARDSKYKLDLINDHLAAKEMEIGRFYMRQKNYIAALNRFKEVVKNYDNTQQIEESLYRLVEANMLLGFNKEALRYATILGYNYSSGKWYGRAYELVKSNGASSGDGKTYVGKVLDNWFNSEPKSTEPAALSSSPSMVDTGSWIADDSTIKDGTDKATDAASDNAKPDGSATSGTPTIGKPAE